MILILAWVPILGALAVLFSPASALERIRKIALVSAAVPFALTLCFLARFNPAAPGFQFLVRIPWLPDLGIAYQAGFDGINLTLCLLHALVSFAGAFVAVSVKERTKEYLFYYLLLTGALYGVFTCLDLFFIYLFYEMTLIPLYPMIGIWGSKNKEYGAMKLTIFITGGAVLALLGLLILYTQAGVKSFDLITLREYLISSPLAFRDQKTIAGLLLVGFGVIASLWPLHSWSPIGYAVAPTSVSMLHAGVLKKMGPYLMLRTALALVPAGTLAWSGWLAVLGGIGIAYAGYAAAKQKDLKYMVGFSSVSHMGYVMLGLAALTPASVSGAVLLMFSHGVMAAATFALIGFLYEQAHTRGLSDFGGLARKLPFFSIAFIMASMASLGLPGFSNFAAEVLIFVGSWKDYPLVVSVAVFGILITAFYLLRAIQNICYGPFNARWEGLRDPKGWAEKLPFVLLLGALLLFGFWPQGLLRLIEPAVRTLLEAKPGGIL